MEGASERIQALAEDLTKRRTQDLPPAPLFLGSAAARAAQVTPAGVAAEVLALGGNGPGADPPKVPHGAGKDEVLRAARDYLIALEPFEREVITEAATAAAPVPLFLQDLALLMRERTFPVVFTTAIDTLLERALGLLGLRAGLDFQVRHVSESHQADLKDIGGIAIVKLCGGATGSLGHQARTHLMRTGVVAYVEEHDPNVADELMLAGSGGTVWWVGDPPPEEDRAGILRARNLELIDGEGADPDSFFANLGFLLLQMPAINLAADPDGSRRRAAEKGIETGERPTAPGAVAADLSEGTFSTTLAVAAGTEPPDDPAELGRLVTDWRRHRCRETLERLRHGTGTLNPLVETQIEYQQAELARLADDGVSGQAEEGLIEVLGRVRAEPELSQNPALAELVEPLAAQLSDQLGRSEPDFRVVDAAVTAMAAIAEGAGVAEELVRELHSASLGKAV